MIDITAVSQLHGFLNQWLEAEGRELIYMPRFTNSDNLYGLCTRCVDERGKAITDDDCPDCYGTGFNGGYGAPLTGVDAPFQRVYGFFNTDKISTDWQKSGIVTTQQNQIVYLKIRQQPALSDLIIDNRGIRFRVGNEVDNWSFNNEELGYVATVYQMPFGDTAYRVPVPAKVDMSGHTLNALTQLKIYQPYVTATKIYPAS